MQFRVVTGSRDSVRSTYRKKVFFGGDRARGKRDWIVRDVRTQAEFRNPGSDYVAHSTEAFTAESYALTRIPRENYLKIQNREITHTYTQIRGCTYSRRFLSARAREPTAHCDSVL